ncbi:MAG: cytochrome b/b6 domain-containing protein [Betaproteobacteria bacterium]|nr:cytochrome b/b6 domain-containing protein [Betaproteobacteria bacterium]
MEKRRVKVWDVPTILFHWLLVLLTIAAFVTGFLGGSLIDTHGQIGLAIAGLLAFRLVWGVIGSTYVRFVQFVPGPARVIAYLRGQWHELGHNPLGAFSVLGLLTLMLFQVASGLVSDDNIAFTGPLKALVSQSTADRLTGLHLLNVWLIVGLVSLHTLSIIFYAVVKKNNLVSPMLTGHKTVDDPSLESARGGGWLPFVLAVLIAAGVVWAANGGLNPAPPPPPPQTAPAW